MNNSKKGSRVNIIGHHRWMATELESSSEKEPHFVVPEFHMAFPCDSAGGDAGLKQLKILTDDPGVQTHLFHVASPFSASKNFNSNPQSKGFLGARRTYFYI